MQKNNITFITLKKKNIRDFALERNNLLKEAKTEWVFFVDSDEVVSKELKKEIYKKITDKLFNGFYVYRKNYFLGKYSGTDKLIRLGKRNSGKWVRPVHEIWQIKGSVGILENNLIHNTAGSVGEMVAKINFYSTLHAAANKKEGKVSNLFKIAFYPVAKFIQSIFVGRGIILSMLQSFHSFLGWAKQWELQKD